MRQLALIGVTVNGTLNGDTLQTGDLFIRSDYIADKDNGITSITGNADLVFARVGTNLDLRGATLASVDLSGASIAGELRLGFSGGRITTWKDKDGRAGALNARTTSIGTLSDTQNGWPEQGNLHLDRVSIGHLGGFDGDTAKRMRDRGMEWWDDWARRDPDFSPAPYTQLATAFAGLGDRDAANEIRFLGRAREREARCAESLWGSCISLFAQEYLVGFGINPYTFRVLAWVFDFSMLGTWVLWTFVPAARMGHRGFLWCCGASLSRLLPVIEINKEFTDFFDDPDRTRLTGWQAAAFSALGIVGWTLGAFLVAALSGLTQGS